MRCATMLPVVMTAFASPTLAAPTAAPLLTDFLLVTTSQCNATTNSSLLDDVSATSLFDPFDQQNFLLRLIGPGYGSLPTFNLTNNQLHSLSQGPEGLGEFIYNSTQMHNGEDLQFSPSVQGNGTLGLENGYLLTVGGEAKGWTICPGQEDEEVISWKGIDPNCTDTYIQAVAKAPY